MHIPQYILPYLPHIVGFTIIIAVYILMIYLLKSKIERIERRNRMSPRRSEFTSNIYKFILNV